MKTIITLTLTETFRNAVKARVAAGQDITIHEVFRDEYLKTHFMTWNLQQDSITGRYTITIEPSSKDWAPLTTLINRFCMKMFAAGVKVDGYLPEVREVRITVDLDEKQYYVSVGNATNNEVIESFDHFDEAQQFAYGYNAACKSLGIMVSIIDLTE